MTVRGTIEVGKSSVIYMGLIPSPNKPDKIYRSKQKKNNKQKVQIRRDKEDSCLDPSKHMHIVILNVCKCLLCYYIF